MLIEPIDPKTGKKMPARLLMPDKHFGTNPAKNYYKPDLTKYPAHYKQKFLNHMLDKACPGDWMDFANFADSPCFVRLKKHLKTRYLKSLETLVLARSKENAKSYADWIKKVLKTMKPKGEMHPVGNIPGRVLQKLKKQPQLALVVADDTVIAHMYRDKKQNRGATLTIEEIQSIPEKFKTSNWYIDKENPALLMTWIRTKDQYLKVVINLDYKIDNKKDLIANHITTSGVVKRDNLETNKRYEKI